jgi:putative transposase
MMLTPVLDLADDGIPIAVTCRVLGLSKQTFYPWKKQPVTDREWADAHLINAAIDIHHDDPEFGDRFITDELAEVGITADRKRVNRLCTQQRRWSIHSRMRRLSRRPGPPVRGDLVERQFTAARPDELWLTDTTEHPTGEGKLYLSAIQDACSNGILGYSMNSRMTSQLAVDALTNACALRRPVDIVVHSDRRSPIPLARLRPRSTRPRPARLDGPRRCLRRQCRHGVGLLVAAEQRPQPRLLADPWPTAPGDHRLGREDLPPPRRPDRSRGLTAPTKKRVNETGGRPFV